MDSADYGGGAGEGASYGEGVGHDVGHSDYHGVGGQLGYHRLGGTGVANDSSGIVKTKDSVEVHIQSHGLCEVRYKLMKLISALELIKIDTFRPNLVAEDRTVDKILPDNAWVQPNKDPKLPVGWYPGATGKTRLWREYFHIGKRKGWIFKGPLEPNFDSRVYLEVECVTRSYIETGDCQTDLVIWVRPLHTWSPYTVNWRPDEFWCQRHYDVAEAIAFQLFLAVKGECPAPADAEQERERRRAPRCKPAASPSTSSPTTTCHSTGNPGLPPVRPPQPDRAPDPPAWLDDLHDAGTSGADIDKLFPPDIGDTGISPGGGSGGGGK